MILIAESGSTKTEWNIIEDGQVIECALTDGINPFMQPVEVIKQTLVTQLPKSILAGKFNCLYYYGSGCVGDVQKEIVSAALKIISTSKIEVESDLCAAARALFLRVEGVACILGTGSNSCYYNGKGIVKNVPSLGFILGDEGGGAVLGKMFLSDCLKGLAPELLTQEFFEKYKISYPDVLDKIYRQPFPNRFLAGFSTFLSGHLDNEYVCNLVKVNFENFFKRSVLQYDCEKKAVGIVGSIAFYYSDILRETASDFGISVCKIMKSAMEGLIEYHK